MVQILGLAISWSRFIGAHFLQKKGSTWSFCDFFFFYSILEFLPLKWTLSCFFQTCFTFLLPCCISNLCWHFVFMCCTIYQEFSIFVWLLYGNRVAIVLTISHHFLIIKLLWNPTQFKYFRENYMSDRSVSIHGAIFPVLMWGIIRRTV